MVASMTAFARATHGNLIWEIKSVNHRNLEVRFRLPDAYGHLEPDCLERVRARLNRGRVDCSLQIERDPQESVRSINLEVLDSLRDDLFFVKQRISATGDISPTDILKWPGVIDENRTIDEVAVEDMLKAFESALEQLVAARLNEGENVRKIFTERLELIDIQLSSIESSAKTQSQYVRDKLNERIQKFDIQVDQDRLATEVAMLAQRADVDEELERLRLHLSEFKQCLEGSGPHGRRLTFLVQEIGREANTLGAKVVVPECLNLTVDLKVTIDQIREHVQNIE